MNNSDINDITKFLPEEGRIYFIQGQYFALAELLKRIPHTFTADLIKQELFQLKLKLMKLTTNNQPPTG